MKTSWLIVLLSGLLLGACATRPPLETVRQVDLDRYTGTWHEIARYPNFFQRHCARDVTAEYAAQPDGAIVVTNACFSDKGTLEKAIGRATVVPGSGNAKLKVSFGGPFAGDYWIIGLDEKNYSWAIVGHPSRKYLWILAREKTLPAATYEHILTIIRSQGYDTERLISARATSEGKAAVSPRVSGPGPLLR